jgi:hypothetical protein
MTGASAQHLLAAIKTHAAHAVAASALARARDDFLNIGCAKVSFIVPDIAKHAVSDEVLQLLEHQGVRRDIRFKETGNTLRKMRNVRRDQIARLGRVVPALYDSEGIRQLLSVVAGDDVLPCPYEPEQFVITCLERDGDTHGWHWDDYSYALVWVIECPPITAGGFVQCVPGTRWDKTNPNINQVFISHPIYSIELAPGDLYFMRTDTTMHRVYPVSGGRRTIVNMGYASPQDLGKSISHETMDSLWSDPAGQA